MKKALLSALIYCFAIEPLCAQAPFTTMDSVDINNINAAVLVHGDMWWNPTTELAHCNFPNGSPKNIGFASAIWMSGYDAGGGLHVAAQTYRQNGNDYWPGPLDGSDTLTYATSKSWDRIWKVSRLNVQYFNSLPVHNIANTPASILTWPGVGNNYAVDSTGTPLTMYAGNTYAPFVDLNGNGVYEPLLGEYPDFPGDQALWWIFSDNGPAHTESNGKSLGVEVQTMAYAYNRGTLIDNVIYYQYKIINRSANTYHNFRLGLWADMDLGYYLDDFIGFDSSYRLGIIYNGTGDDGASGGHPLNSYGTNMPQAGVTLISLPGDVGSAYIPAGSFDTYNNDNSDIGNPHIDSSYNYYLRAMQGNGVHITGPLPGTHCIYGHFADTTTIFPTGSDVNYFFPGDPSDTGGWSECACGDVPGDRRFVLASNDFTVLPGSTNEVVMALVTTNLDSMHACPGTSFTDIKIVADTAWEVYHNPPAPITEAVSNLSSANNINIYPDPAHDKLYIENNGTQNGEASVTIYNTLGQVMNVAMSSSNATTTVSINELPAGVYYLQYRNGNEQKNVKFIKD